MTATTRITVGLVSLAVSVWLLAFALGLLPNRTGAVIEGRIALCENVALHCSLLASRNDLRTIESSLEGLVRRNDGILSAAVRRPDGSLAAAFGPHARSWTLPVGEHSTPSQMRVPVLAGDAEWGSIEVRFQDPRAESNLAWIGHPLVVLCAFLAAGTYLLFFFYLRKMLKHLDPSRVIPRRVRQTLDTLAEGLLVLDKNERILLANQSFADSLGKSVDELTGRLASELAWDISPGCQTIEGEGFPWQRATLDATPQIGSLLSILDKDKQRRTFKVSAMPVCGDDGVNRGTMASFDDITELEKNRDQLRQMLDALSQSRDEIHRHNLELERLAGHDPLTDCLNRRAFFTQLESQWHLAVRHDQPLACIMFDLDHFKSVNDTHGHQAGDRVLVLAAKLLREGRRSGDLVCRYGGEEFCVFLPQTELEQACIVAERLRQTIESADFDGLKVTASIGVSARSLQAGDPQKMIDQADKCLYVAKRQGRNQVVRFDEAAAAIAEFELHGEKPAESDRSADMQHVEAETSIPFHAVTALVSALAFRDPSTAEHSRRVADLCAATARRLMSASESYILEIAALLHDIGKIGVPDSILLKPGKLTEEEWQVMNSHERIGAEIIQSTFACPELTEIIHTYRAWFGGNPQQPQLPAGDDIAVSARVLAIADAYDAMTHRTAYREPLSREQAFDELRRCTVTQFDPDLVERFIDTANGGDRSDSIQCIDTSKAAALSFGTQIERLSEAIDKQDRGGIAVLAKRLNLTATKYDSTKIAEIAGQLADAAGDDREFAELVQLTNDLVDLCRSAQRAYLYEAVAPIRREASHVTLAPKDLAIE